MNRIMRILTGAAVALCFALLAATNSQAGEKGKWRGLAVLVTTKSEVTPVADQKDHSMMLFIQDGAVFNSSGSGFLDRARYQVTWAADTAKTNGGYKTFTAADGSLVFAYTTVTEAAPPDYRGTWEFTGGTGKYKGIRGKGVFHVHSLSDVASWDVLEGDYEIP
jgi:hypothetical protein